MATLSTFFDMVYVQVSGTPGTGTATLGSALIGFQTAAAAGITNGTPVSYRMTDGTNWETAHGTIDVSGSTYTLVRGVDTIKSSNSNSLVSFGGSGVTVLISPLSQDLNALVSAGAAQSFTSAQQAQGRANIGAASVPATSTGDYGAASGTSTSGTMFGAGFSFTPSKSGSCLILVQYGAVCTSQGYGQIRYGTGAAPSQGSSAAGSSLGYVLSCNSSYIGNACLIGVVSLTVGTTYWFDLILTLSLAGTLTIYQPQFAILEF